MSRKKNEGNPSDRCPCNQWSPKVSRMSRVKKHHRPIALLPQTVLSYVLAFLTPHEYGVTCRCVCSNWKNTKPTWTELSLDSSESSQYSYSFQIWMESLPADVFRHLTKLVLQGYTHFHKCDMMEIMRRCPDLHTLQIATASIPRLCLEVYGEKLAVLELDRLREKNLVTLAASPSLMSLTFHSIVECDNLIPKSLGDFSQLIRLCVKKAFREDDGLNVLANLTNLQLLEISFVRLNSLENLRLLSRSLTRLETLRFKCMQSTSFSSYCFLVCGEFMALSALKIALPRIHLLPQENGVGFPVLETLWLESELSSEQCALLLVHLKNLRNFHLPSSHPAFRTKPKQQRTVERVHVGGLPFYSLAYVAMCWKLQVLEVRTLISCLTKHEGVTFCRLTALHTIRVTDTEDDGYALAECKLLATVPHLRRLIYARRAMCNECMMCLFVLVELVSLTLGRSDNMTSNGVDCLQYFQSLRHFSFAFHPKLVSQFAPFLRGCLADTITMQCEDNLDQPNDGILISILYNMPRVKVVYFTKTILDRARRLYRDQRIILLEYNAGSEARLSHE